ncbi:unnamed protein product [Adineta steineri]|uniref:NADH dehydrogenase [ubiquinone] 1 beta subcomplex subunit 7 n=1 Tax=Adineta steineri TaxID=433720 RepID=A0A820A5L7_9BILA|nr:unnamed protein product [Adineta steineri]CAF1230763.1 unnamed protein product [Adineta steineri]CAF3799732.1 unnamed protein product [Adineta steineri]CAF4179852.1 unnamed protein product [Adineta steineri]
MGLNFSGSIDRAQHPEQYPEKAKGPTFDPLYGFADGRKTKVAPYTQEEMQTLNIPLDKRDYCAHYFRAIMLCTQQYWPSQYGYCEPERHAWEQCQIQNKLDDAKEYERELRLRRRRLRKEEKTNRDLLHKEHTDNNEE